MKLVLKAFAVGLLFVSPIAVAADADTTMVYGAGTKSCGAFLEAERKSGVDSIAYHSWLAGFLTGVNAFFNMLHVSHGSDILEGTDFEGAVHWLRNYCEKNPLETFARAADALVAERVKSH